MYKITEVKQNIKLSSDFQNLKYYSSIKVDVCFALGYLAPATHIFKLDRSVCTLYLNVYLSKIRGIWGAAFYLLFFLKVTHFFFTYYAFLLIMLLSVLHLYSR